MDIGNGIRETIKSTILAYEKDNQMGQMWKEPIIEIISANNESLKTLKEAVSAEHCMPRDILPDAKSIICFFIPFQDSVVHGNNDGTMASKEWAMMYVKTNDLIKVIGDQIELFMEQHGYKTGKIPATHNFNTEKLISNWSHRHIAYIAGMGTFGKNNMLITKNGCCGRLGSVIINYEFAEYKTISVTTEKCLSKAGKVCGICQKKCVINAYENENFDRHKCYAQCLKNSEYHEAVGLADVCGKCLVGLPCSVREPSPHHGDKSD